jgi:hypothetical protein
VTNKVKSVANRLLLDHQDVSQPGDLRISAVFEQEAAEDAENPQTR